MVWRKKRARMGQAVSVVKPRRGLGSAFLALNSSNVIQIFSSLPLGSFGEKNRASFCAFSSVFWLFSFSGLTESPRFLQVGTAQIAFLVDLGKDDLPSCLATHYYGNWETNIIVKVTALLKLTILGYIINK